MDEGMMPDLQELLLQLHASREKLFANHNRGMLTATDIFIGMVDLMLQAPDDERALGIYLATPDWFRQDFRDRLSQLAQQDYYARWYLMEDIRTSEQVEVDAKRHQEFLQRMAPRMQTFS